MTVSLEVNQAQTQTQNLFMTHQQHQALALLRASGAELEELIEKELIENPMLERAESENSPDAVADAEAAAIEADLSRFEEYSRPLSAAPKSQSDDDQSPECRLSNSASLAEALLSQLSECAASNRIRTLAAQIIGNLDDDGYLDADEGKNTTLDADFAAALELVQSLEPAGVGARSLKESLSLQLERRGLREGIAGVIVDHHLELVAARKFELIAELTMRPVKSIVEAVNVIRALNPFPGRATSGSNAEYVIPDVMVRNIGGEYVVLPAGDGQPKVQVASSYRELVRDRANVDRETRAFVCSKLRGAAWFVQCIMKRERTVLRIAEEIVRHEREFFEKGIASLKPLTLRDIGSAIGVHESTVSRAVAGKYIETPRGIFEFKFFFAPRLQHDGVDYSTTAIREKIRLYIRAENPVHPLSDQAMVQLLSQEKIAIARRTVTKYRENLGIPPSALRRRDWQLETRGAA